jgi:hypothetical protein
MKKKRCGKCFTDIQASAQYCPQCGSIENWLPTPKEATNETPVEVWKPEKSSGEPSRRSFCPECGERNIKNLDLCDYCNTRINKSGAADLLDSPGDLQAAQRESLNKSLGVEKVAQYQSRLQQEIDEIQYQQWRSLQPEWEQVAGNLPKVNSTNRGVFPNPTAVFTTASGVMLGTAGLRHEVGEIQEKFDSEGSENSESESGFFDFLG